MADDFDFDLWAQELEPEEFDFDTWASEKAPDTSNADPNQSELVEDPGTGEEWSTSRKIAEISAGGFRQMIPAIKTGADGLAASIYNNASQGATQAILGPARHVASSVERGSLWTGLGNWAAGKLIRAVAGDDQKAQHETRSYKLLSKLSGGYDEALATPEQYKGSFLAETLPNAAGALGAQLTVGAMTGGTGSLIHGGMMAADGSYEQAVAEGATEGEAQAAAGLSGVTGAVLERFGVQRLLSRFGGNKLATGIGGRLTEVLKSAGTEGATEFLQGLAENGIAKAVYDSEGAIVDWNLAEEGAAGAILGGTVDLIAQGITGRRAGATPPALPSRGGSDLDAWFAEKADDPRSQTMEIPDPRSQTQEVLPPDAARTQEITDDMLLDMEDQSAVTQEITDDMVGEPVIRRDDPSGPRTRLMSVINRAGQEIKVETDRVPLAELSLSEDVPNFKEGSDKKGVVNPIEGESYDETADPIHVWRRLDGRKEVISGRHRLDLANRDPNKSEMDVRVYDEADGFDAGMAMMLDAELNIRDGNGSYKDFANYFRNAQISEQEIVSRGLRRSAKGRAGSIIGTQASDALYDLFANGRIGPEKAAEVARHAPGDTALQDVAIDVLLNKGSKDEAIGMMIAVGAEIDAGNVPNIGGAEQVTMDSLLGGSSRSARLVAKHKAKAYAGVRRLISEILSEARTSKKAAKANVARNKKRGITVDMGDPEATRQAIDQERATLELAGERLARARTDGELQAKLSDDSLNAQGILDWLFENPIYTAPPKTEAPAKVDPAKPEFGVGANPDTGTMDLFGSSESSLPPPGDAGPSLFNMDAVNGERQKVRGETKKAQVEDPLAELNTSIGRAKSEQGQGTLLDGDGKAKVTKGAKPMRTQRDAGGDANIGLPEGFDNQSHNPDSKTSRVARESFDYQIFAEAGHKPDDVVLMPPAKQFDVVKESTAKKFGLRVRRAGLALRESTDQLMDAHGSLHDMAHAMKIPLKAIGLGGRLGLSLARRRGALGFYRYEGTEIQMMDRFDSFAHEWGHALDHWLHDESRYVEDAAELERGKPMRTAKHRKGQYGRIDMNPEVDAAFTSVMRAIFQDDAATAAKIRDVQLRLQKMSPDAKARPKLEKQLERLQKGSSRSKVKSQFAQDAAKIGTAYWKSPVELWARAVDAYVSGKLAQVDGQRDFAVSGEEFYANGGPMGLLFPKADERRKIEAAFDELFHALRNHHIFEGPVPTKYESANIMDPNHWPTRTREERSYAASMARTVERERVELSRLFRSRGRERRRGDDAPRRTFRDWRRASANMVSTFGSSTRASMKMIEKRYQKEGNQAAVKPLKFLRLSLGTEPGGKSKVSMTFHEEIETESNRKSTKFLRTLRDAYGKDVDRLSPEDAREMRDLLVATEAPKGNSPAHRAAREIRRQLDAEYRLNRNAGVTVGYARNGYLPRMYDRGAAWRDQSGFQQRAGHLYQAMIDIELAEAAIAEADGDPLTDAQRAAIVEGAAENIGDVALARAGAWQNRLLYGSEWEYDRSTPADDYTKGRDLPPEADAIMGDFMVADPIDAVMQYMQKSSRRLSFVRRFGLEGEKYTKVFTDLAAARVHPEDVDLVKRMADRVMGMENQNQAPADARAMNWFSATMTMAMLPRATWASLAEPFTIGMRTGRAGEALRTARNLMGEIGRTQNARDIAELSEFLGIIADASLDQVLHQRFGGVVETPGAEKALSNFFRRTGLTGLTRAQRRVATRSGLGYLRYLGRQIESGSNVDAHVAELGDLGVTNPKAMIDWLATNPGIPTPADLEASPVAGELATALNRFANQTIQNPEAMDRPHRAGTPTGRVFYAITSFNMAFYENLMKGSARRLANREGQRGRIAGGLLAGAGGLYVSQLLIEAFRQAITSNDYWERRKALLADAKGVEAEEVEFFDQAFSAHSMKRGVSRAFPVGMIDVPLNVFGGFKYNRDPAASLSGAHLGYVGGAMKNIMGVFGNRNAAGTNTSERYAVKGMFELFMVPTMNHALSRMPAGPLVGASAGAMMQAGSSGTVKNQVQDLVAGRPTREVEAEERLKAELMGN